MAKKSSKQSTKAEPQNSPAKVFGIVDKKAVDPGLASLFASSLGPVERPPRSRFEAAPKKRSTAEEDDEELSEAESDEDVDMESGEGEDEEVSDTEPEAEPESENEAILAKAQQSALQLDADRKPKKRKRGHKEEDLEDTYMKKLALEDAKDEEKRRKKQKTEKKEKKERKSKKKAKESDDEADSSGNEEADGSEGEDASFEVPKHETEATEEPQGTDEMEKASRTVFLGNVSNQAITSKSAKKTLMNHLASFLSDLPDNKPPHKVESLRFRSTAFASAMPKKAAYAQKEVMDATTKSTNAYVVYSTQMAAREAARRLNGTIVLDRHLRVDSVAHPAKVDNRRCVFVGNLGFVDDESALPAAEDEEKRKKKPPADVEEGLWVHFSKAGKVESVRVVRDPKTRVGKGFAYVQFVSENGVEAALQFNDQRFPPLLPRKLRVVRAKATALKRKDARPPPAAAHNRFKKNESGYQAKVTDEQKSMQGRAGKLLGKAGAFRSAESFVFEGHRARPGADRPAGKKRAKSRAAAWKAAGGKKPGK
jgi:nucleolar protein 12